MWNYITPLFSFGFWFNPAFVPFTPWADKLILIAMLLLFVAGIGVYVYARKAAMEKDLRRAWRRGSALLAWSGFSGLFLYAMNWQRVPVLSMRAFYLVWLGGFGWWAWIIFRHVTKELPKKRAEEEARRAYEKWLPKPKK